MVDCTGREIRVQDLVSYPVRQGSGMWVNLAVVGYVTPDYILASKINDDGSERKVRIHNSERVTIALRGSETADMVRIVERIQPN